MPRKPRRNRGLRTPRANTPKERKQAYVDQENRRLEAEGSPWRYGFSSADPSCICLVAADNKGPEGYRAGKG
jgi:hypothetical protein